MIASASPAASTALRVEQDDRAHQPPADRRGELVAGEQGSAVLEAHPPLGAGERAQPMAVDQHVGAGAERDQPGKREEGDQQQDRRRDGIKRGRGQAAALMRRPDRRRLAQPRPAPATVGGIASTGAATPGATGSVPRQPGRTWPAPRPSRLGRTSGASASMSTSASSPICATHERSAAERLQQRKQAQRRAGDQQRLQRDGDQDRALFAPLGLACAGDHLLELVELVAARACRTCRAGRDAALAGEPLKNTRTISLNADFFAAVSDTAGL